MKIYLYLLLSLSLVACSPRVVVSPNQGANQGAGNASSNPSARVRPVETAPSPTASPTAMTTSNLPNLSGIWEGISTGTPEDIPTQFVLQQQGNRLSGTIAFNYGNGFQQQGVLQGSLESASGSNVASSMVVFYQDGSYTQFSGNIRNNQFAGTYQFVDSNGVVLSSGQAVLNRVN